MESFADAEEEEEEEEEIEKRRKRVDEEKRRNHSENQSFVWFGFYCASDLQEVVVDCQPHDVADVQLKLMRCIARTYRLFEEEDKDEDDEYDEDDEDEESEQASK